MLKAATGSIADSLLSTTHRPPSAITVALSFSSAASRVDHRSPHGYPDPAEGLIEVLRALLDASYDMLGGMTSEPAPEQGHAARLQRPVDCGKVGSEKRREKEGPPEKDEIESSDGNPDELLVAFGYGYLAGESELPASSFRASATSPGNTAIWKKAPMTFAGQAQGRARKKGPLRGDGRRAGRTARSPVEPGRA